MQLLKNGRHYSKKYDVFFWVENGKICDGIFGNFERYAHPYFFDKNLNAFIDAFGMLATKKLVVYKLIWK